jgi:hypothetical protein
MIDRRTFAVLSIGALGATVSGASPQTNAEDTLRSEFLFDLTLVTKPGTNVGFPGGDRLIVGVSGGTFAGPKLKGTVTGVGGDWIVRRPGGSSVLDVRVVFLTDDDQKIYTTWRGIAYTADGALHARILPMFETDSPKYLWLNNVVSVGVYRPSAGAFAYRVHQIL